MATTDHAPTSDGGRLDGSARRGRVVIVDDDPDQRAVYGRWLEMAGHQVTAFPGGREALAGLAVTLPDAVCLDLQMPELTGLETLERVRKRHPALPVIVLTADTAVESIVSAIRLGAYDYLPKPADRTKLLTIVRNAIERHRMAVRLTQLKHEVAGRRDGILGSSSVMSTLSDEIDRVALTDVPVLIQGESGTGKELVARAIHATSARRSGQLVALNCAAIPQSLQEAELFGHEKGAFTGAVRSRAGRFELADEGTLFLDEVGELAPDLQAKLLRVLQERSFYRVGGNKEVASDFRLVAATHRDLRAAVSSGRFREDLYFRLAVFELTVPPLRDRDGDQLLLADHFAAEYGQRHRGRRMRLDPETAELLEAYRWPGNVRELQNAIQRAVVTADGDVIRPADLPARLRDETSSTAVLPAVPAVSSPRVLPDQQTLESVEARLIADTLRQAGGNVSEVARRLGIGRTALYRKLRKYSLR